MLVKHAPKEFRAVLLFLFNFSWRHGVLPDSWRLAHVSPIYKGAASPRSQPKSYRPISLTSCLCKIFEMMILERLVDFLDAKRFFSTAQSGFRRHHNTLDQIYRLIARVQESFQRREYVSVCFLDIVAAFDSVWHQGLLFKLHRAGITGRAWRWIKAFLSDRKFRVVSEGSQSQWFDVAYRKARFSVRFCFWFSSMTFLCIAVLLLFCMLMTLLFGPNSVVRLVITFWVRPWKRFTNGAFAGTSTFHCPSLLCSVSRGNTKSRPLIVFGLAVVVCRRSINTDTWVCTSHQSSTGMCNRPSCKNPLFTQPTE